MYASNGGAERARWNVLWLDADGEIEDEAHGNDFASALASYTDKAREGVKGVTLHSGNMGFAPPDKYADTEVVYKTAPDGRRYLKKGKPIPVGRIIVEPKRYTDMMNKLNAKGWWWCPYCAKARKFERVNAREVAGRTLVEPAMICPLCGISHNDGNVQKYNPAAAKTTMRLQRRDAGTVKR